MTKFLRVVATEWMKPFDGQAEAAPTLGEIAAVRERLEVELRGLYEPLTIQSSDLRVLLARIDRLDEERKRLPVLRTCGDCGHRTMRVGGRDAIGRPQALCVHDDVISGGAQHDAARDRRVDVYSRTPPPSWCPLRGGSR